MKLVLVAFAVAPVLVFAGPAAAQSGITGLSGDVLTPPLQPQTTFSTGQYDFPGRYDDKTTRIDRRNSARFKAAKMARKARQKAEREARQPS